MNIELELLVYEDNDISVALFSCPNQQPESLSLGICWLDPKAYRNKNGTLIKTTNVMGGETDWFILPFTFAVAIGKQLIEQKVAGLEGFNAAGFTRMVEWLVDLQEVSDAMCY